MSQTQSVQSLPPPPLPPPALPSFLGLVITWHHHPPSGSEQRSLHRPQCPSCLPEASLTGSTFTVTLNPPASFCPLVSLPAQATTCACWDSYGGTSTSILAPRATTHASYSSEDEVWQCQSGPHSPP